MRDEDLYRQLGEMTGTLQGLREDVRRLHEDGRQRNQAIHDRLDRHGRRLGGCSQGAGT